MKTDVPIPTDAARAGEILASYGADARRWPAAERDAAAAMIAIDPELRAARREAAALDTLLDEWAGRDLGGSGDAAAAAARALIPTPRWQRWAAGGGIAAVFAAWLIAVQPLAHRTEPVAAPVAAGATVPAALTDEAAFATVFTPTPDEESVI